MNKRFITADIEVVLYGIFLLLASRNVDLKLEFHLAECSPLFYFAAFDFTVIVLLRMSTYSHLTENYRVKWQN